MNLEKLEVKVDYRGKLVEAFKLPSDGLVFYLNIKPGEMRGNHFHLRKTEHFLVVGGSAVISVRDKESGTVVHTEVSETNPLVVHIHPNNTHNITAGKYGCICLIWCDEQFNEEDSDTYPEEI